MPMLRVHLLIYIPFPKHPSPLTNTIPHHIPAVATHSCQRCIPISGFTWPPERLVAERVRSLFRRRQPCLGQFGFVMQAKTTTNVGDDNSTAAPSIQTPWTLIPNKITDNMKNR